MTKEGGCKQHEGQKKRAFFLQTIKRLFFACCLFATCFGIWMWHPVYMMNPAGMDIATQIWYNPEGSAKERLNQFQLFLGNIRESLWTSIKYKDWRKVTEKWNSIIEKWKGIAGDNVIRKKHIKIIDPFYPTYLDQLRNLSNVITVYLTWQGQNSKEWSSGKDKGNLLYTQYYGWAADEDLCRRVETRGKVDVGWALTPVCPRGFSPPLHRAELRPTSLFSNDLYASMWHFYSKINNYANPRYVTYINIYRDVFVDKDGVIYSSEAKIFPYSCTWKHVTYPKEGFRTESLHKEVFSIAQIFGANIYHRNVDQLPRVALYLNFLKRNPQIKIHVGRDTSANTIYVLRKWGFDSRLLLGDLRTQILYSPEGNPCGYVNIPSTQAIVEQYLQLVAQLFGQQPRNSIVIIRRSRRDLRRKLVEQEYLEHFLNEAASNYSLEVFLYAADNLPSFPETMKIFNRAVMVVGLHGAGMFNMMFCKPGTYIIEILTSKRVMMCFQRLAHVIGHRYYGIAGTGKAIVSVDKTHLAGVLNYYLPHAAALSNMSKKSNND